MTTGTATRDTAGAAGSSLRRNSLLALGALLAAPALFGLLAVTIKFMRQDIDFSSVLTTCALLAAPYSAGLLTLFYALNDYRWPSAIRYTLVALAVTIAALVLLKFIALALPTFEGSDDDDDDDRGLHLNAGNWLGGWSDSSPRPYGRDDRTTLPIFSTKHSAETGLNMCPACSRHTSGHGICSACSTLGGTISPWGI